MKIIFNKVKFLSLAFAATVLVSGSFPASALASNSEVNQKTIDYSAVTSEIKSLTNNQSVVGKSAAAQGVATTQSVEEPKFDVTETEPNDTAEAASAVDTKPVAWKSYTIGGKINSASDTDYYSFTVGIKGTLGLGAFWVDETLIQNGSDKDLSITLYDSNNNVVLTSGLNDQVSIGMQYIQTVLTPGKYTFAITQKLDDSTYVDKSYAAILYFQPSLVEYKTHVENEGWQDYAFDGETSGTEGQSLRLEAININIVNDSNLGITYSSHVQDIGWQNYVSDGATSGTEGQSKRLEAIKIKLTGADADLYDVYYSVHVENNGWLGWAKDGEAAGTEGLSLRLEAIEIVVVAKSADIEPDDTTAPFISAYGSGLINYRTHVQNVGWQNYVSDGALGGTTGQSLRLEAINIRLNTNLPSGSVVYSTHVQNIGWMNSVSDGALSGTQGQSKRLEAIKINLSGDIEAQYDVYYRVHAQNIGWMGWAKNGESAGTAGLSLRLEGIDIVLVAKGGDVPGSTDNSFIQG